MFVLVLFFGGYFVFLLFFNFGGHASFGYSNCFAWWGAMLFLCSCFFLLGWIACFDEIRIVGAGYHLNCDRVVGVQWRRLFYRIWLIAEVGF